VFQNVRSTPPVTAFFEIRVVQDGVGGFSAQFLNHPLDRWSRFASIRQ
jgi:hypothetical protein